MDTHDKENTLVLMKQIAGLLGHNQDTDVMYTSLSSVLALLIAKDEIANNRDLSMAMDMTDLPVGHMKQQVLVYYEKYTDQIREGQTIQ